MKAKKLIAVLVSALMFVGLALVMMPATEVHAADYTVDSKDDAPDNDLTDGVCDDGTGNCTLRAAIMQVNYDGGGTINFGIPTPNTITLTDGELKIDSDITINGPGADMLTISRNIASGRFRIFNISGGTVVTISGVTITNGKTRDGNPGIVGGWGDPGTDGGNGGHGGGIYNQGMRIEICVS